MYDVSNGSPQLTVNQAPVSPIMAMGRASPEQIQRIGDLPPQVIRSKLLPLPVHDEDISRCMDAIEAMEVDLDYPQALDPSTHRLIVILDTNVWIANTALIDEVLNLKFNVPSGSPIEVTIMIPWMVLQEIDHLIHGSAKDKGFRMAAKYIQKLLSSKHPRVKGQKASEAVIGKEFTELMADDSILNCVIKCAKQCNSETVFITNDINLLNKALVHEIASFKADNSLIANLRKIFADDTEIINQELQTPSGSESGTSGPGCINNTTSNATLSLTKEEKDDFDDIMEIDYPNGDFEMETDEYVHSNGICSDAVTFEAVVSSLQRALTNIIVLKMVEEYGQDGWKFAIKIKPPFNVESALKCLQVHWIAVFSYIFSSRAKVALDELLDLFKKKPINLSETDVKKWRLTVCEMTYALLSMLDKANSRPRVAESFQLLQKYIERVKAA